MKVKTKIEKVYAFKLLMMGHKSRDKIDKSFKLFTKKIDKQ